MEPRAGCRLPVRVEQVVNGALLVTVSYGQRSFAGILLDCTKKYGLFGLPLPAPPSQAENGPVNGCQDPAATEEDAEPMQLGMGPPPPLPPCPEPFQALLTPLPAGSLSLLPPYFEGAPFPPPLWLRRTYQQWVPQPPPRPIKRTRRRLSRSGSRNSDSGQLTLSSICLRPRRVLCEKCKSTLNAPEASPAPLTGPRPRRRLSSGSDPDKEPHKQGNREGKGAAAPVPAPAPAPARRSKRERREEAQARVPRSPAIRISYSTPQGAGEVVQIPPRVHGSLEPFHPPQALSSTQEPRAARDRPPEGPSASVPKLKLTRPVPPSADLLPPKIRLKPHRLGAGKQQPVYKAELVEEINGLGQGPPARPPAPPAPAPTHIVLVELSSGSSGEEDEAKRCPQGELARSPGSTATSARASVCSGDSLEESKSSSSEVIEVMSPDAGDPPPGAGMPAPPSSEQAGRTVPPLTVRLHAQSLSKCVSEDGRTVAVGDVVWGKIHGFPWWPARVLDVNVSPRVDGAPPWQQAKVSWFGSRTTSHLPASKLCPFSACFKRRFNRKKRGLYRKAVLEAADATRRVAPEVREFLARFDT